MTRQLTIIGAPLAYNAPACPKPAHGTRFAEANPQHFMVTPPETPQSHPRRRLLAGALAFGAWPLALRAQFRVEISGVGGTQLPIGVTRFRDEDKSGQSISGIVRADLERSGVFRVVDSAGEFDETSRPNFPEWRGRGADALTSGSTTRLADGRFRRALQAVGRGQGPRPRRPGDGGGDGRPAPGGAPHRRCGVREAHWRQGRVFHSHRLRHAGGQPLHAARDRCRRRGWAGGAEQHAADHLAGLGARWQVVGLCVVRERQGGGVVARRRHRRAPRDRQFPRQQQRARVVARRAHAGRHLVARRRLADLPDGPQRQQRAPRDAKQRDRHRAGFHARWQGDLFCQRPRRQPADLPCAALAAAIRSE